MLRSRSHSLMAIFFEEALTVVLHLHSGSMPWQVRRYIYVLNQFCTCHQHGGLAFSLRFHTIPWQLHSQFEIFEM